MKTVARRRAFAQNELLMVLALIAVLVAVVYYFWLSIRPLGNPRQQAIQAKIIHGWLMTYAGEHGGNLPTGDNANAAYRELFKIGVGADEKQFFIPNDPWHQSASGARPDGVIGQAPDFAQALGPGENAFAYVSGLNTRDTARIPLIANAFTARPGVWTNNRNEKGGVYAGKYAVVCSLGGSASSWNLNEGDWTRTEKFNGHPVNIFTPGFEDTNFTVLNPQ